MPEYIHNFHKIPYYGYIMCILLVYDGTPLSNKTTASAEKNGVLWWLLSTSCAVAWRFSEAESALPLAWTDIRETQYVFLILVYISTSIEVLDISKRLEKNNWLRLQFEVMLVDKICTWDLWIHPAAPDELNRMSCLYSSWFGIYDSASFMSICQK